MKIYRNCGFYRTKLFQAEFFQFTKLLTLQRVTLLSVLPVVHAFTGCDSSSKIGSKKTTLKIVENNFTENLSQLGTKPFRSHRFC